MTPPTTGPGSGSGPLGDEARALVEAARDWVARTFPESHSPECQWCPVCRTVAALRSPEAGEKIAGVVTAAAGALAAVLDSVAHPPAPPAPAAPLVRDIPLDEEP